MTKMTDAFKKFFLDLGGNPKLLAENNDVGDYILDLESAIKDYVQEAAAHELPTPAETNVGKVATVVENEGAYSWGVDNIPSELPTPAEANVGKVATVVSDGEGGYNWDAADVPTELPEATTSDIGKVLIVNGGTGPRPPFPDPSYDPHYELTEFPVRYYAGIYNSEGVVTVSNMSELLENIKPSGKYFAALRLSRVINVTQSLSYNTYIDYYYTNYYHVFSPDYTTATTHHVFIGHYTLDGVTFYRSVLDFVEGSTQTTAVDTALT